MLEGVECDPEGGEEEKVVQREVVYKMKAGAGRGKQKTRPLSFGLWNTCGLSRERQIYAEEVLSHDVLGLVETWGTHEKLSQSERWITCKGQCAESDPAAGVAIRLSLRASQAVLNSGSEGQRIVWVRLQGQFTNYFVVVVYLPQRHRDKAPRQDDTMDELAGVLEMGARDFKRDCVVVMGDMNLRLPRSTPGITGKYCVHGRADQGGERLMDLMYQHDLCAVSTMFRPRPGGRTIAEGKNKSQSLGSATYIPKTGGEGPKQIDYVLMSRRWSSSVESSRVRWSPSKHRWGHRWDHGLVEVMVKSRVAAPLERVPRTDWTALNDDGVKDAFNLAVQSKLREAGFEELETSEEDFESLQSVMMDAIEETVPKVPAPWGRAMQELSEESRKLFADRERAMQGAKRGTARWYKVYHEYRDAIYKSRRRDRRLLVESWVKDLAAHVRVGHAKEAAKVVRKLAGKREFSRDAPSRVFDRKGDGRLFDGPDDLAAAWGQFAREKFKATGREKRRPEMPELETCREEREGDVPSEEELEECLKALASGKATQGDCGDAVPVEAYRASEAAKQALFKVVRRVWREEEVPERMVRGIFCPIWKRKGSVDDMSKHRFVCLLSHVYKVLSALLHKRLIKEVEKSLPEWQAGFRPGRSTVDNIFALSRLIQLVIEADEKMLAVFIDFTAAFDSVAHKWLDEAMGKAGASDKSRAVFRAIYAKAIGAVRVRKASGEHVTSESFPIQRGVLQGDIFSPLLFVCALDSVMVQCDTAGEGVAKGGLALRRADYADDSILLEQSRKLWQLFSKLGVELNEEECYARAVAAVEERLNSIAEGAEELADMEVSVPKTYVMHIRPQGEMDVGKEDHDEFAKSKEAVLCSHCGEDFGSQRGLATHERLWCPERFRETYDSLFEVERILKVHGPPRRRYCLVEWKEVEGGWTRTGDVEEDRTWEPIHHLARFGAQDSIDRFWAEHPELNPERNIAGFGSDEPRCQWCCKLFKNSHGLKIHLGRGCRHKPVSKKGSQTERKIRRRKRVAAQARLPKVRIGAAELKNHFDSLLLGHSVEAGGEGTHAVEIRGAQAKSTFGKLMHLWDNDDLWLKTKLLLYQSGVLSVLTYGQEAWQLTEKIMTMLRGWNARCLARITGRTVREETVDPTFDLIKSIRVRRLRWVGHVLRKPEASLDRKALFTYKRPYPEGSVLMDVPPHGDIQELATQAKSREKWNVIVNQLNCQNLECGRSETRGEEDAS